MDREGKVQIMQYNFKTGRFKKINLAIIRWYVDTKNLLNSGPQISNLL